MVENVDQVGVRRHIKVIYHLSGKAVDAVLFYPRALQGRVEEAADLSIESWVGLLCRGSQASSLSVFSGFGGSGHVRFQGAGVRYFRLVGLLVSHLRRRSRQSSLVEDTVNLLAEWFKRAGCQGSGRGHHNGVRVAPDVAVRTPACSIDR